MDVNVFKDLALNAPLDSANALIDAAAATSSAVEPTLASLGLASSFPGGIVQAGLEALHIGLDVPWWGAIVIGMWNRSLLKIDSRLFESGHGLNDLHTMHMIRTKLATFTF